MKWSEGLSKGVSAFIRRLYIYIYMERERERLTKGWTVRDRIAVGTRFSARPDRPWGPPSLL